MILYVDLEHRRLGRVQPDYYRAVLARRLAAKYRFEALTGEPCLIVHYTAFDPDRLASLAPRLTVFSGHNTGIEHYEPRHLDPLRAYFAAPTAPTFTICGSFQLMAEAHGAAVGPIGPVAADAIGAADPILPADQLSERGYCEVLFADHGHPAFPAGRRCVFQHHFWQVHEVPRHFTPVAASAVTRVQALAHATLPLAGVQFHPEDYDERHPDGRDVLVMAFGWLLGRELGIAPAAPRC